MTRTTKEKRVKTVYKDYEHVSGNTTAPKLGDTKGYKNISFEHTQSSGGMGIPTPNPDGMKKNTGTVGIGPGPTDDAQNVYQTRHPPPKHP